MSGASKSSPVEDTVKDMWATRPRRPRRGRKVAGVAAGIGERYGIDPVVPRVLFAVLSFYGGAGVLLYVLGWLLLPEEDDEVSPLEALAGKGRSATSGFFTIVLSLSLIPLFGWFFDKDFSGFFGLVIGAGVLFFLHRNRAGKGKVPQPLAPEHPTPFLPYQPPTDPASGHTAQTYPAQQATGAGEQPTTSFYTPSAYAQTYAAEPTIAAEAPVSTPPVDVQQRPPAWDPLGAAPFAWDLPEPSRPEPDPEPPAPRHKRSKAGLVTVGVALLAVGGLVLAGPSLGGWLTVPHLIGVVLGVLGLGMFLGAFRGGGAGLLGLAAPLAAVGVAMTVVWPGGWVSSGGLGDLQARPATLGEVQPAYQMNVGSVDLDLTALPATGEVRTTAMVDMGDVHVTVPATADVQVFCRSGAGDVQCLNQAKGGGGPSLDVTDYGSDGPGGLKVVLHAETTGFGTVEVNRG